MQPAFVHLRLHTEFSLVDGIVKIKPLVKRLAELNMPAIAITEHANLFSLVKFYKASLGQGIKAIAGADVLIFNPEDPATPYRLTLLVNNHAGYITLTELISKAYQEGQHQGVPMLRQEWIEANHNGLIALSGAMNGEIGRALLAENHEAAKRLAEFWGGLFEQSFYLELQRVGKPEEERYIAAAVELALATGLPVVATNDVRFVHQQDFAAHEVRVCINQGRVLDDTRRPKDYTDQQYLRSVEEMQALFADIPEALENTVEIAKRCNLKLTLGKNFLPDFPVPEGMNLGEFMTEEATKGLEERLQHHPAVGKGTDEENRRVYYERLDFELKMITQMGFPGYFMIVADFIQWAKNNFIPVGPGRGSGAGSLVAYALKITDLDPIEFDLLFERFLNPERISMPDFDVDFCMDRRDEVIDYVARNYGRDHVAQIITYGSMAAKAVIRDVGRVLGFGYGFVDRLSKLVPFEIGMTLTKALKDSPELKQLYDTEEEVKALIDMALSLEGTSRNAGKHAGGVVISPTKLTDFTPLYCDQDGNNLVTQFDKDDVEAVGLVKFDFLGLRTLTIIDWALQDINAKQKKLGKPPIDITTIPRDDPASYKLLTAAQTTAVFQLESRGMKELIKKLKPDCFDDIIALVALFRPGPLESGMVDDYINVKHGAKAEYAHPLLEPILKPTNGVILYQEQVMQIAREMALYTLGGADMLRRAMGKKKPEEMAKERDKFTAGAIENQVDEKIATYVFDLMEKFAGYGFNKSHSAAYALVAYQTAWLKAHYQPEFMAAVMSADMDNTDKVVILIEECRQMKLEILPPTINISKYKFTVNDAGQIVYGLGALKGVGEAAIEEMLVEREAYGPFSGLYDLCKRVDLRKFNRRVLEALIRAGAFDEFD
ncbi:MAG: DNA polymerase III subunit alpha, partial [Methylobacter sp.]